MYETSEQGDTEGSMSRRSFLRASIAGAAVSGLAVAGLSGCTSAAAAESDGTSADGDYIEQPLLTAYATPPLSTIEEKQENVKKVLVVVDYQVDFVDGILGNDYAPLIEDAIYDKVKEYQDAGDIVCYTMDTHPAENYTLTREGSRLKAHCVPGTDGWEVYGKVRELLTPETATMVKKGTYGSMYLPDVLNEVKNQGTVFDTIELAGVSTTACVFHNAVMLFNNFPECNIVLDATTTASSSPDKTTSALDQLSGWGMIVNGR